MNCETFQRLVLWAEEPARLAPELQGHFDACGGCRDWHARLCQFEQHVPLLPVPPSTGRTAFLERLQSESPTLSEAEATQVAMPALPPASRFAAWKLSLRGFRFPSQNPEVRRHQYVSIGVAAAVLICVLTSVTLFRPDDPHTVVEAKKPVPDPLVVSLLQGNLNLAVAESDPRDAETGEFVNKDAQKTRDRKRAEALAQMAGELFAEIKALPDAGVTDLRDALLHQYDRLRESLDRMEDAKSLKVGDGIAARPAADGKRVQQLKRNRDLIADLVDGGVRLVREDEPIKRANSCRGMAQRLASEIRQAARNRDSARAVEMGQHFRDLLTGGIAQNVATVRPTVQGGSMLERDMKQVGEWVNALTAPLEDQLARAGDADMRNALDAIHGGRTEVERAIKG